jgi:membrane protein implicated in regulation of membrane protease activity
MVSTIRLYVSASYAIAVMATVGILSGFAAAGMTGDTLRGLQVALAMFAATGALLTVRLWRMTQKGERSPAAAGPPQMRGH